MLNGSEGSGPVEQHGPGGGCKSASWIGIAQRNAPGEADT